MVFGDGNCLGRSRLTAIPCFCFRDFITPYKSTSASARSRWTPNTDLSPHQYANKKDDNKSYRLFYGVGDGTWTHTDCSIRTWNVRVYHSTTPTFVYFIFLKNSLEINCEYLSFSFADIKILSSPSFVFATDIIPPISPIGSFFTRASNLT